MGSSIASMRSLFSRSLSPLHHRQFYHPFSNLWPSRNPLFRFPVKLKPLRSAVRSHFDMPINDSGRLAEAQCLSGENHVIVGPMFAGMTTALLRWIQGEAAKGRKVAMIKSDKDTRYAIDSVVTHDGARMRCLALKELSTFRTKLGVAAYDKLDVIGIDEAQFFEDLYDFCCTAADRDGKTIIVAGLDGDYLRRIFGLVLDIIPLADSVTKLTAQCDRSKLPPLASFCSSTTKPENEWEKLLKPFDLESLRQSFNRITPARLCKLLELPLDISTSMQLFKWAGAQKEYSHSFDVYHTLITKLGKAGEFKTIEQLLQQSKDEGIVLREPLFIFIMSRYGKAGLPGSAVKVLDEMSETFNCGPTFRSYNVVLDILVSAGCYEMAANLFFKMMHKGVSPATFTFSIVMKALCAMNKVEFACSLRKSMVRHGCVQDSVMYQTLIHALHKENRVTEALRLLEEMIAVGCSPNVRTCNYVIHGLCKVGQTREAAKLIDRMLDQGCTPIPSTYGVLLHGLCSKGQVNEARALLQRLCGRNQADDMRHVLNREPNSLIVLFNTVINGYVKEGRLMEAKDLYDNMIMSGCYPDIFTYNIIICGLCKERRFRSAMLLLEEMESNACMPNIITYTILIDGFCKDGLWEEANGVLEQMSSKGLSLNTKGYNCLISALCKDRKVELAIDMVKKMKRERCKPDIFTFNYLIYGLCKVDRMEEALCLYDNLLLESVVANNITYNTLIHAVLQRGNWQKSLEIAKEMMSHGCSLDVISYNGLIKALCHGGEVETGLGMFEEMMRKGIRANNVSYNLLINGLCKGKRVQDALELLKEMLHRGFTPDIVTYNTLINGLCKMGWMCQALNLLKNLHAGGLVPDTVTYNILISWHCKANLLDDANLLLYRAVDGGILPNTLTWDILVNNFIKKPNFSIPVL